MQKALLLEVCNYDVYVKYQRLLRLLGLHVVYTSFQSSFQRVTTIFHTVRKTTSYYDTRKPEGWKIKINWPHQPVNFKHAKINVLRVYRNQNLRHTSFFHFNIFLNFRSISQCISLWCCCIFICSKSDYYFSKSLGRFNIQSLAHAIPIQVEIVSCFQVSTSCSPVS